MKKAIVTGSRGFIGQHLIAALRGDGWVVNDIDRRNGPDQDVFDCEIAEDAGVVFHLAAQTSVQESMNDPIGDATDNIAASIRLMLATRGKKLIMASSGAAKDVQSPYGASKRAMEDYARILRPDAVVLRFPNVYGPGGHGVVEEFIKAETVSVNGTGVQTRDFVHVQDIVRGMIQALDWDGGLYEMGSGKSTAIIELAEATRKPIDFKPALEGEVLFTETENTTPDWAPEHDVLEYVRFTCNPSL